MPNCHPKGLTPGLKAMESNSSKDSCPGEEKQASSAQFFFHQFKKILIIIFLSAVLIAAVLQPLFREPLLARLRSIVVGN